MKRDSPFLHFTADLRIALLALISRSVKTAFPSSATGGGRKATNQFVCKHDTNKTAQYIFDCFGFATKTNGDH